MPSSSGYLFSEIEDHRVSCGVDEVGRGPLAGPVVASAVVLDTHKVIDGITDSKKLTPIWRWNLACKIKDQCASWAIGICEAEEIDELNILRASLLAMQRAFEQLTVNVELALIDGIHAPLLNCETQTIIKGDSKVDSIGAASILAKVERDQIMTRYHDQYPEYGFSRNFGYPTPEHLKTLKDIGPCPIHRKSFRPVAMWDNQ